MVLRVNVEQDMNIDDAINAAIDVAAHSGVTTFLQYGGVSFSINVPNGQIPVRINGVKTVQNFSDEVLFEEYIRRCKTSVEFRRFVGPELDKHLENVIKELIDGMSVASRKRA